MVAGPSTAGRGNTPSLLLQVRCVHALCFPGDPPAHLPDTEWLDRAAVCHEAGDCVWLLLWRVEDKGWGGGRGELAAICAGAPYSTSLYGFALGVAPGWRGAGLGPRIMHGLQAAALARGRSAVAATVDAASERLLAYYASHGGVVEATGVGRGRGARGGGGARAAAAGPHPPPPPPSRRHRARLAAAALGARRQAV